MAGAGGSPRVLVVDDEPQVAQATAELLRRTGYTVDVAASGQEAVSRVRETPPDLMLLDYEMADMDALDVLQALSEADAPPPFPVLIYTGARLSPADQVMAFESGARDYVPKGSGRQVLMARLRAALRDHLHSGALQRGKLRLDLAAGRATLAGRVLDLDWTPLRVLHHLASREGQVVTKQQLLSAIWGTEFEGLDHAVEQAVYAARVSLGDRRWIETVHRRGYRFVTLP